MAEGARRTPGRVLILAHTQPLVEQNMEACRQLGVSAAPCAAGLGVNPFGRVVVGTIQTVVRRLERFRDVTRIFVDETHLVPPNEKSMYRRLFDAIPLARVHGVTGTPYRADGSGSLEESFGPCVYRYAFSDALAAGYVKPLRQIDAVADEIDTAGVRVKAGEWSTDELAHRGIALAPAHARAAIAALRNEGRKRVLVFACDIAHAEALAEEFNSAVGRKVAEAVHSRTPDQDTKIEDFRAGRLPIMTSVQKFAVGFSVPEVDALVLCRPVRSRVYYVQALGRGARKTDVALDCVVIDFGGNVARHGALDMVTPLPPPAVKNSGEKRDRKPHKTCAACGEQYALDLTSCPACGYDPRVDRSVGEALSLSSKQADLLATAKLEPRWLDIVGAPRRTSNRHWRLPVTGGQAIWWPAHLPPNPVRAYLRWDSRWGFVVDGVMDEAGVIHTP